MVTEDKKYVYAFQDIDDVHISLCLNCGKVVGDFPVNIIKREDSKHPQLKKHYNHIPFHGE